MACVGVLPPKPPPKILLLTRREFLLSSEKFKVKQKRWESKPGITKIVCLFPPPPPRSNFLKN